MQPGARQVILVLYRRGWATAVGERLSFSEARLAVALHDHPGGGRLLLVNPYRSPATKVWRSLRPAIRNLPSGSTSTSTNLWGLGSRAPWITA
jgi:hypothetical protein